MPRLDLTQKKQLERWIGSGPKTFTLLYSFSRDGAAAATFHQLCNGKGPTVTVIYNTQDSIYGGYTETSWDSSDSYYPDHRAFLFRLAHSRKAVFDKFPNKTGQHGIYCPGTYGPTFGGGSDLQTFKGKLAVQGNQYTLNGGTTLNGTSFDMKSVTKTQITNDINTVTDLEVYSVTDSELIEKWRTTPEWNAEYLQKLKQEVERYSIPRELKLKAANILVLGPVGAGKSSFFNTIASVFRGYVTGQACSGSAAHSITSMYRMYSIRPNTSSKPMRFRLCDTMGLEESHGIDSQDISFILDGNVPDGYQFNPSVSINSDISGFKETPSLSDKIHCVCFVIDGSTVSVMSERILEKIKDIKAKIHQKGVPQVVLVTKIDKVCSHVEDDVSTVFQSEAVSEIVDNVSVLLGFPRGHVLPMKNYEKEVETSDDMNILALLSLRQMLRATEDYMMNCFEALDMSDPPTLLSPLPHRLGILVFYAVVGLLPLWYFQHNGQ